MIIIKKLICNFRSKIFNKTLYFLVNPQLGEYFNEYKKRLEYLCKFIDLHNIKCL